MYFSNLPVGSSGLNSAHIIQMFYSKKPHKYDYGKDENIKRYGQESPPDYIMENINSTNIALIYSHNDVLNDLEDIKLLKKHLKGIKIFHSFLTSNCLISF